MRAALIAAASLAAIAAPAAPAAALPAGAEAAVQPPSTGSAGVRVHRNGGDGTHGDKWKRHHRPRHPGHGGFYPGYVLVDREYQGDTTWKHDSFNDWWHERPHRAFPRWVSDNRNCDRRWWSGGVWRC